MFHRAQQDEDFKETAQSSQRAKLCARSGKDSWRPAEEEQPRGVGTVTASYGTYWYLLVKNTVQCKELFIRYSLMRTQSG